MTYRLRNIGIAIALALVAALLTTFYVSNYKRTVQRGEESVEVYVAKKDIPAGTPGADVAAMLETQEVARRSVAPGAISSAKQVEKLVSETPIYAGEQVTTRRFSTVEEKGVRAQLTGNQRAYQLPGDRHQLLAGTLKEGDRVDVVGNWEVLGRKVSRIVLRDILVLKAPGSADATTKLSDGPNAAALSAILAVTDSQSQKLFWVAQNGGWTLDLRPPADAADSPESAETAESLLLDGFKPTQLRAAINSAERLVPASERNQNDDQ